MTVSNPQGERSEETLEAGKSREVGFRLGNLAGTVYIVARDTDLRRAFLGALAASRFGAHPGANLVQVTIRAVGDAHDGRLPRRGATAVGHLARCHVRTLAGEPAMRSRSLGSYTWLRPVSPRPLAGLRVGLPLLLLFHLVWLSNDFLSLHGSRGIIPWEELTDLLRDPLGALGSRPWRGPSCPLGIGEHTAVTLLLSGYAPRSLLSIACSRHFRSSTRLSAFLAWGLHLGLRR